MRISKLGPSALLCSILFTALVTAGCGGSSGSNSVLNPGRGSISHASSGIPGLHTITTIGSTVDPLNGDQNPYGLAVSPVSAGAITKGDLVICNFNDAANVQGNGTTIEVIHPTPGSAPMRLLQSSQIQGCGALTLDKTGSIAISAKLANDNPIVSPSGTILTTLSSGPWNGPWGEIFDCLKAVYVSNANDGSIVRISILGGGNFSFTTIATGFSVNHGVPGSINAPAGLSFDQSIDTLYIVDTNTNRVVAFSKVSLIGANGITVSGSGFSGPSASSARVVFSGSPLNTPLSSALLANHNLVVGNTGDNLLIEISPGGALLGSLNLDSGAPGALFGIATAVVGGQQIVYFNDDNSNTVKMLTP